jgi:hypothetical protein
MKLTFFLIDGTNFKVDKRQTYEVFGGVLFCFKPLLCGEGGGNVGQLRTTSIDPNSVPYFMKNLFQFQFVKTRV